MSSRTRIALIAVAVLIAAYPLAAWLIGIGVQSHLQRTEQQLLNQEPYLVLVRRDYHRGVYRATEDLTFRLGGPLQRVLRAAPGGAALLAVRLTVHNTIVHGPLPNLRSVALATVDSQFELPAAARGQPAVALAGAGLVRLHTTMGFGGGGRAELTSPAFNYRGADGTSVDAQGLSGTLVASRGVSSWSGQLSAPGFELQGGRGRISLSGLAFAAQQRRAFGSLYVGTKRFTLSRLEVRPAATAPVLLQGVSLQSASSADAQYVDATAQLSADSVQSAQFSATHIGYAQSFSHLYGPSLALLTQALRDSQRTGSDPLTQVQVLAAFREYGTEIALHEPVLQISRLGFVTPDGQFSLSGQLSIPGLQRSELQDANVIVALTRHAQATLDLRVDSALVAQLLGRSNRQQLLSSEIEQFQRQGYLTRDGTAYTLHVDYRAGRLTLNGQPYPPAPSVATP